MNIAILGALGFLGKNLSNSLILQGHKVTAIVLEVPTDVPEGLNYLKIDTLLKMQSDDVPQFDILINLAARRSTTYKPLTVSEVREFTYEIPLQVIQALRSRITRIINASTYIQNFEGKVGQSVDSYGAAKQELSMYLEKNSSLLGVRTFDIFLFTIFGSGDRDSHLIPSIIRAAKKSESISLSPGNQLINLIHIDDVVSNLNRAISLEVETPYQKYYMWEEEYISVKQLVQLIELTLSVRIKCNWGERPYAGHEMFSPWPIPMPQIPGFKANVTLEAGIRELWSSQ